MQLKKSQRRKRKLSKKGKTFSQRKVQHLDFDEDNDGPSDNSLCAAKNWKQKIYKLICNDKKCNDPVKEDYTKPKDKKALCKKNKRNGHNNQEVDSPVNKSSTSQNGGSGSNKEPSKSNEPVRRSRAPSEVRGSPESPWRLYYDGASVMSHSYAGSGAVLKDWDQHTMDEFVRYIGPQTMNVAEYVGLLGGLRLALNWNVDHLCCYGDSRVVHNQIAGSWRTRGFKMAFLWFHAQELIKRFKSVKFVYIRRKKNMHAARLAHEAINIQWDREVALAMECEEENQRAKNEKNDDKIDEDDEYYEYRRRIKKKRD